MCDAKIIINGFELECELKPHDGPHTSIPLRVSRIVVDGFESCQWTLNDDGVMELNIPPGFIGAIDELQNRPKVVITQHADWDGEIPF